MRDLFMVYFAGVLVLLLPFAFMRAKTDEGRGMLGRGMLLVILWPLVFGLFFSAIVFDLIKGIFIAVSMIGHSYRKGKRGKDQ